MRRKNLVQLLIQQDYTIKHLEFLKKEKVLEYHGKNIKKLIFFIEKMFMLLTLFKIMHLLCMILDNTLEKIRNSFLYMVDKKCLLRKCPK